MFSRKSIKFYFYFKKIKSKVSLKVYVLTLEILASPLPHHIRPLTIKFKISKKKPRMFSLPITLIEFDLMIW